MFFVGEGHLRVLLDSMQDCGIVMLSRSGMILSWNGAAEQITGYTAGDVVGQHISLLYPAEDIALGHPSLDLETAASRGSCRSEGWWVRKDTSRVWVSHVITALHDRTGRLRGFGTATRVLSDWIRPQDMLAVLDAVPDAVLGVDARGRVLLANAAAEQLFDLSRHDLIGKPIDTLLPSEFLAAYELVRSQPATDGQPPVMTPGHRAQAVRADGSRFACEVRLSSVQTPRGQITTAMVRMLADRATTPPHGVGRL